MTGRFGADNPSAPRSARRRRDLFSAPPLAVQRPGVRHTPPDPAKAPAAPERRARLSTAAAVLALGFTVVGGRTAHLTLTAHAERPDAGRFSPAEVRDIPVQRAEIHDRGNRVLATSLLTYDLSADPRAVWSPDVTAQRLSMLLGVDEENVRRRLMRRGGVFRIQRRVTPDQRARLMDQGLPGLLFDNRMDRIYPIGRGAAHLLGWVNAANQGVTGLEQGLENRLTDPDRLDEPVRLSVDLRVQAAAYDVLSSAQSHFATNAAAAIVLDARSGEVLAMASQQDFDPNNTDSATRDMVDLGEHSPTFNHAAQGLYELGSVFKVFTAAAALETGEADFTSPVYDARGPITTPGGHKIDDAPPQQGRMLSLQEVIQYSSNIGAARIAGTIGIDAQQNFLGRMGMLEPMDVELPRPLAPGPTLPANWGPTEMWTIAFGHGIAVSPLQYAAGLATLTNGGCRVRPTFLRRDPGEEIPCEQVVSADISQSARQLLRIATVRGGGKNANVRGYEVAGKTGTAEKTLTGRAGYTEKDVRTSFAAVFPASDPQYVVIVMLDEPKMLDQADRYPYASLTAAPVAGNLIERVAPILGVPPIYAVDALPIFEAPAAPEPHQNNGPQVAGRQAP